MSGLGKVVRAAVGLVVIVVLLVTINLWYGQYKADSAKVAKTTTTSVTPSTPATSVVPIQGQKLLILVDGLSISAQPATGTASVRALKKGEQLILVGSTANSWYQVRDSNGKMGYVRNTPKQVKAQ